MSTGFRGHNQMKRAPRPPDSPELPLSDLFLFGYVTGKLMGYGANSTFELPDRLK
jgi:hypothetical protein